jgi:hypothetical protein
MAIYSGKDLQSVDKMDKLTNGFRFFHIITWVSRLGIKSQEQQCLNHGMCAVIKSDSNRLRHALVYAQGSEALKY